MLGPLYEAIKCKDENAAREWTYFEHWENMKALIQATTMNWAPQLLRDNSVEINKNFRELVKIIVPSDQIFNLLT